MELNELIMKTLDDKKGENIVRMDFKQTHAIMDEMIVCEASNSRLVHAIVEALEDECAKHGYMDYKIEGRDSDDWVLFYIDHIVVSVFLKEAREFYNVERLWKDFVVNK